MEEKIQELIEKLYNYDILRIKVSFKDFGKYIIEKELGYKIKIKED